MTPCWPFYMARSLCNGVHPALSPRQCIAGSSWRAQQLSSSRHDAHSRVQQRLPLPQLEDGAKRKGSTYRRGGARACVRPPGGALASTLRRAWCARFACYALHTPKQRASNKTTYQDHTHTCQPHQVHLLTPPTISITATLAGMSRYKSGRGPDGGSVSSGKVWIFHRHQCPHLNAPISGTS